MNAGANDPALDAAASINSTGRTLTITVVNPDPSEGRQAVIQLKGGIPRTAGALLLAADNFLPGSSYTETPMEMTVSREGRLELDLPKHSVARITVGL
ncbi:MAG: hypothetical protein ABIF71_05120 [Planctomycetota bacterium]